MIFAETGFGDSGAEPKCLEGKSGVEKVQLKTTSPGVKPDCDPTRQKRLMFQHKIRYIKYGP